MRICPDGFLGAVLGAEGCGVRAVINGPGGCRSRAVALWRELSEEYLGEDPGCCLSENFSRQSALPCTYLTGADMVLGSTDRISGGLRSVLSAVPGDVMLIGTLASSLQAADIDAAVRAAGAEDRIVPAPEGLSSMSFAEGFDAAAAEIARRAAVKADGACGGPAGGSGRGESVTVLGYTVADASWHFGMENIRSLLSLLGADEVSFIGCLSSEEDLEASLSSSSAAVEVHPEMCRRTAEVYRESGIRAVVPKAGAPVGFDAIRSFLNDVSDAIGASPDAALKAVDAEEERCMRILRNCDKDARAFRGLCCAAGGMPSDLLPLLRFMRDWFGMLPGSVEKMYCGESVCDPNLERFLRDAGAEDSIGAVPDPLSTAAFFSDGYTAAEYKAEHPRCACVGISMPFARKAEFRDSSIVGLGGCRFLLDGLINGRGEFSCGQPTMADFRRSRRTAAVRRLPLRDAFPRHLIYPHARFRIHVRAQTQESR